MSEKKLRKSERRKLRKRKKALRISRGLSIVLIVGSFILVIGYIAYISLTTGTFNIETIEVNGNEILTDEKIIEASEIDIGQNIFLLDTNEARFNISKILSANEIYIQKVLPNKIIISIEENSPLAVINYNKNLNYIDDKGVLMEVSEELGNNDTPLITGFESYEIKNIGEPIVVKPEYKFQQIVDMLKLFESNDLLNKLSQISLAEDNSYKIISKNGVVFTVKDFSNLKEFFDYVSTVIENGESNLDINLTSGDNPIRRPR